MWAVGEHDIADFSTFGKTLADNQNFALDGDGKTDAAVFRPSDGYWYALPSTGGEQHQQWGISTDKPVPGDYDGDSRTDITVWRPSEGTWYILRSGNGSATTLYVGGLNDMPVSSAYLSQ
jgi:hypothetical protein